MPLAEVLAQLPPASECASAAAARRALADAVATGLLDALRHAHARGVAHSNLKIPNVVLAPPPPPGDIAALLAGGAWRPRGVLIDWGTARALGAPASVRQQGGFQPDATETLLRPQRSDSGGWYWADVGSVWLLHPRHDLECVAYLAAAVAGGGGVAAQHSSWPPWWPWTTPDGGIAKRGGDGNGGDAAAQADTGLSWVGPVACARAAWLRAHPDALGEHGRRFLQHARAGRPLYTWRLSDEEHAALLLQPAAEPVRHCSVDELGAHPDYCDNGPEAAARAARAYAAAASVRGAG